MKVTLTHVDREHLVRIMELWHDLKGVQMLLENEGTPGQVINPVHGSWPAGAGITTTYSNGTSFHTPLKAEQAPQNPSLEGYWVYEDNKGKKDVHYIKKLKQEQGMTYCGISVNTRQIKKHSQPGTVVCTSCEDLYNSAVVYQT